MVGLDLRSNQFSGCIDLRAIIKPITNFTTDHMDLEFNDKLPPPDMPFGLALYGNLFEGDIRVMDLDSLEDDGQFAGMKCENIVDTKGNTVGVRGYSRFNAEILNTQ